MCAAGRDCASMCFLAKLLTTSRAGLAGSAVLSFGYGKPLYSLIYNNRAVRKAGLCGGQRMGVCLLPGKSLSGARTGLTDSAVSAFGCSAAVLFYQSGTARRSAPPPFSPSSQQWGMGREPHGCPPLLTFPQSTGARISPFPVMGYGAEAPCSPIALALLAKRRAEHGALPSVPLS